MDTGQLLVFALTNEANQDLQHGHKSRDKYKAQASSVVPIPFDNHHLAQLNGSDSSQLLNVLRHSRT